MDMAHPADRRRLPWLELAAAAVTACAATIYLPGRMATLEDRVGLIDRRQVRVEETLDRIAITLGVRPLPPMVAPPRPREQDEEDP